MWSTYGTDGLPADQINLQQTPLCVSVWITLSVKQGRQRARKHHNAPVSRYLSSTRANNIYFCRRHSMSMNAVFNWLLHSYSELLGTTTVCCSWTHIGFSYWTPTTQWESKKDPRSADLAQSDFNPRGVFCQPSSEWPSTLLGTYFDPLIGLYIMTRKRKKMKL